MLGYGMAKAAVHQLTLGLGQKESGLPAGSTALAILPYVLLMKLLKNVDHLCVMDCSFIPYLA
jgi:NAD(P)-dependent dehydrogenase (short-subunit alcohol dehydrogenase family)